MGLSPPGKLGQRSMPPIKEELKIKTHYESLDIAQSRRVHYLLFTLPATPLPLLDEDLQERSGRIGTGREEKAPGEQSTVEER